MFSTDFLIAQTSGPSVTPVVSFDAKDDEGNTEHYDMTQGGGTVTVQAPVSFEAKTNVVSGDWTMTYIRWTITGKGTDWEDEWIRETENFSLSFDRAGQYSFVYDVVFENDDEEIEYTNSDEPMKLVLSESALSCPDGFSPNDDHINDYFRMTTFKSIVKLEGGIFNRWGKKLFTFTLDNAETGWDGRVNGDYVKDGAYLLYINAYGSEGRHYEIKKAINVLKGWRETGESSGN